jgi:hypothetical protein
MHMQSTTLPLAIGPASASILGVAALALVVGVFTRATSGFPVIGSDRGALIALVAVGMTMCALGGIGVAPTLLGWTHPVTIAGIVLGTVIGVVVVLPLVGRGDVLVPLASALPGGGAVATSPERAAMLLTIALMALKWLIATVLLRIPAVQP